MAKLFKFEVVTPSRILYSDEVELVVFETEKGQMGIMADHIPMLIANKMGILKVQKGKETKYAFISEGFFEIHTNKVDAIVDAAEWYDEIDIEQIKALKKDAEEQLADEKTDKAIQLELKASIERSNARIKVAERGRLL